MNKERALCVISTESTNNAEEEITKVKLSFVISMIEV